MEEPSVDIGPRLREARKLRGLTILDIESTTKIPRRQLLAIEREDFDALPVGLYRRSYVRAYASTVGLDADEVARDYVEQFESLPPLPVPPSERHAAAWRMPLLTTAITLAAGSVLLPILRWSNDRSQGSAEGPQPGVATAASEPAVPPPAAVPTPAAAPDTTVLRVDISVAERCWISAVADGEPVVYRLVEPGAQIRIAAASTIRLRVGNAGGVSYTINGVAGRTLGQEGEAVTLDITPANYRTLLDAAAVDAPSAMHRAPARAGS